MPRIHRFTTLDQRRRDLPQFNGPADSSSLPACGFLFRLCKPSGVGHQDTSTNTYDYTVKKIYLCTGGSGLVRAV
jgi:hypothetical protein